MSIKVVYQSVIALTLMSFAMIGTFHLAAAQSTGTSHVQFEQTDVRTALRQLFRNINVSYAISPNVQGVVTVDLRNVTFETALQNILRQVDATYRINAGVYQILRRQDQVAPNIQFEEEPTTTRKPSQVHSVITQDGKYLYIFRGDDIFKVQKSDLKVVKTGTLAQS